MSKHNRPHARRTTLRAFLSAAALATAFFPASVPDASAVTIGNGETKTPAALYGEGWNGNLSSLSFYGTYPSGGFYWSDITAILSLTGDYTFNGTTQRLALASSAAGAIKVNNASTLVISGNNNTTSDGGAVSLSGSVFRVFGEGSVVFRDNKNSGSAYTAGAFYGNGGAASFETTTTFSNNSATATNGYFDNRAAGAIYNHANLRIQKSAVFSGNYSAADTPDSSGSARYARTAGAIFQSAGFGQITNASFSSNTASSTYNDSYYVSTSHSHLYAAGAVHNFDGTLTLQNTTFTSNSATADDSSSYYLLSSSASTATAAGAILNESTLVVKNSTFTANTAYAYAHTLASAGAILNLGTTASITLEGSNVFTKNISTPATSAAIRNNGAVHISIATGETASFSGNGVSIANTAATATTTVTSAGTLDMRDPLSGGTVSHTNTSTSPETPGTWKLGGASTPTAFTFTSGVLHLYRASEVANATTADPSARVAAASITLANANTFSLGANAILSVGGGNAIAAPGGTIQLANSLSGPGTILEFDMTAATTAARLALSATSYVGPAIGNGVIRVNNATALANGLYTLVDASGFASVSIVASSFNSENFFVDDALADAPLRLASGRVISYALQADATRKKLNLVVDTLAVNGGEASLTWTGAADDTWQHNTLAATNWSGQTAAGQVAVRTFLTGDTVHFDDTAPAAARTVNAAAIGVFAAQITVDTADTYTFTGGEITVADHIYHYDGSITGGFTKTGPGKLVLANTASTDANGAARAINGPFTLRNGSLQLGAATATTPQHIAINGGVTLANGATLLFKILPAGNDRLFVKSLSFADAYYGVAVNFDISAATPGIYTLIDSESSISGLAYDPTQNITTLVNGAPLTADYTANYALSADGTDLLLSLTETETDSGNTDGDGEGNTDGNGNTDGGNTDNGDNSGGTDNGTGDGNTGGGDGNTDGNGDSDGDNSGNGDGNGDGGNGDNSGGTDNGTGNGNTDDSIAASAFAGLGALTGLPIRNAAAANHVLRGHMDSLRETRRSTATKATASTRSTTSTASTTSAATTTSAAAAPLPPAKAVASTFLLVTSDNDASASTGTAKLASTGVIVGADALLTGDFALGASLGGFFGRAKRDDLSAADGYSGSSNGDIEQSQFRLAIHASYDISDSLFLDGIAYFGYSSFSDSTLDTHGQDLGLALYSGNRFALSSDFACAVTPYIGLEYVNARVNGAESGLLAMGGFSQSSFRAKIGATFRAQTADGGVRFALGVSYARELADNDVEVSLRRTDVAGARTYSRRLGATPEDIIQLAPSMDFVVTENCFLQVGYAYEWNGGDYASHHVHAALQLRF